METYYGKLLKAMLWILYCSVYISRTSGQTIEVIDCTNEELVTSIFNDPIELTLRGIIKIYEGLTINEIVSSTNNEFELNYIDARLEASATSGKKNLILFTTEHFENYAKEQTAARISLKINFSCGMGKERVVIFFQPLKEGNYFSPVFSQPRYELMIPTPIFTGFDLTAFLEITANDDDLTHNQIIFTSDDSSKYHISVGTKNVTSADKKTYFATLTLQKILLELPAPVQFEIVATDNGDPPKSSTASVVIRSDPSRSLPVQPKFPQTLYKGFINFDFAMEPIKVQLATGTYAPDILFSLRGVTTKGFSLHDNNNGSLDIVWNPVNLNTSEILKLKRWELELRAEHVNLVEFGRANVIVELADFKGYFHFMDSYYEGNIDELGQLHIEPIIFNPYMYKSNMEFKLETTLDFFHINTDDFRIQLQLANNFSWKSIDGIGFIRMTLLATWQSLSSMTNVIINLPHINSDTTAQTFQFEKPLYMGQLNATNALELETILLQTDIDDIQDIHYSLKGNESNAFYVVANGNHIEIKTNFTSSHSLNTQATWMSLSDVLVLEAEYNDHKTFTTLVITKPQQNTVMKNNIFTTSLIVGRITKNNETSAQELLMDPIHIASEVQANEFNGVKFHLRGVHSAYFEVRENFVNHTLHLVLRNALSSHILDTTNYLNLSLLANSSSPTTINDTLIILIQLPVKECSQPPSDPPRFSSESYVFSAYENQIGILGTVSAFSRGTNATFQYILETQNDFLAQCLSISPHTGELFLFNFMEEGNYLFNITAENIQTHERTVVRALLKVQQKEECKSVSEVAVETTLLIRHVDEEKPYHGLLDMKFNENCTFDIVDMWPNDKEYVHVNYIFNMLDTIAIDREDLIFENMSEPQIVVKLRLRCDHEDVNPFLHIEIPNPIERRGPEMIYTEDIPYSADTMWLYLKIDDINDNPPEFKLPEEGPLYLGYPAGNVAFDIYPEYLTQIEAFDRDVGFNAQIKFTMRENPYFDIEPTTGKIFPKGQILQTDQQTELIVVATDQYGEGLVSGMVVIVKGLAPHFYSLITLRENSTKSRQELETALSQETGYKIRIIKMSYVPLMVEQRSAVQPTLNCKAWIYAYHRHQPVQCRELQEQFLVEHPEVNIVNIESYDEASLRSMPQASTNNLGYLVAITFLSLISVSSLIFLLWHFCYKPSLNSDCDAKLTPAPDVGGNNGNVHQHTPDQCTHDRATGEGCFECNKHDSNRVKFSGLVEESQSK